MESRANKRGITSSDKSNNWQQAEQNLADKLEELYPKGETKCRSQALVFNAYAVMEIRNLKDECKKYHVSIDFLSEEVEKAKREGLQEGLPNFDEINKAREEGRKSVFGLSQDETVLLTMYELDELRTKFREEGRQEGILRVVQLNEDAVVDRAKQEEKTRILGIIEEMKESEISPMLNKAILIGWNQALEAIKEKL